MKPLRIGIVGAGFSGTSLAATLHKLAEKSKKTAEIFLFEKSGQFGPGVAYATTSPFHLLNVPAEDMSAIEMEKRHFSDWLARYINTSHCAGRWMCADGRFVSRCLYGDYLRDLTAEIAASKTIRVHLIPEAVTAVQSSEKNIQMAGVTVDRVVLATGNPLPPKPLFAVSATARLIDNPWDQRVYSKIAPDDSVVLLGSGLSMIDSVLSLYHQQHRGTICSVSRHGLLPEPHAESGAVYQFEGKQPVTLSGWMKYLRAESAEWMRKGENWRAVIHAMRGMIPEVWGAMSAADKRRFLVHCQTYWNIHRHRVPKEVSALLQQLQKTGQLRVVSARVHAFQNETLLIRQRGKKTEDRLQADWLINCTGPSPDLSRDPLILSLLNQGLVACDPHQLGLCVSPVGGLLDQRGKESQVFSALGSLCRGRFWEITAVPDIRRYNHVIALALLKQM